MLESQSINTIESLDLSESADFSSDETCTLFAQFIDKATKLKECPIYDQCGERKVSVELQVDETETGGEPGQIKITNKSGEVIVEMQTSRTTSANIEYRNMEE